MISQYLVHTGANFNSLSILNFNNLVSHRMSFLMFKYSKILVPLPIVELFTRSYEFHNQYTRHSQSLHTAVGRKEMIYKTFFFVTLEFRITYLQKDKKCFVCQF